MRALLTTFAVAAAAFLAGSGLAAIAFAGSDLLCLDEAGFEVPEGSTFGGSLDAWPLGTRCEYELPGGASRAVFVGPTVAESLGWSALTALLLTAALALRPRPALARGAAVAACLLGLVGAALHGGGFLAATGAAVLVGIPLVALLDHALAAPDARSWAHSLVIAAVLVPIAYGVFALLYLAGPARVAIVAGLLAGAFVSAALASRAA